jgi:hypothetical protein
MEDELYNMLNEHGHPWFIKHVPVPDRPKYLAALRRGCMRYFGTDYTAYEAHFVEQVMATFECRLYRHMLKNYPVVADFICDIITGTNVCYFNGIKMLIPATRMSGEMCTSLGNGFTNLMMMLYVCNKCNLTCDGYVEGDDGIFAVSGEPEWGLFKKLGFTITKEEVEDPKEANFCGMICSSTACVKDPFRVLSTFGWTFSFIHAGQHVMMSLLRAKSLSLAYELGACPVVCALARRGLYLTRGTKVTHTPDDFWHHTPSEEEALARLGEPTFETRELFQRKYGIDVAGQLRLEYYIEHSYDLVPSKMPELEHLIPRYFYDMADNVVRG